jgi:hypothetical protein
LADGRGAITDGQDRVWGVTITLVP